MTPTSGFLAFLLLTVTFLGAALWTGFTGRLTIHYRSPTPLHTELRFACELTHQEGRKTSCTGALHAGDVLCAEAEGLFIAARPGILDALSEKRAEMESRLEG